MTGSSAVSFAQWRQLTPVEAVAKAYAAIRLYDDPAVFIALKPEEEALAEAERLIRAGPREKPLFGLPFVVKDNIDVAGFDTTAACPAFAYRPERSAHVVDLLVAAGAICLGKTNLDQFATGLVGVRSPYGVPRNALRADLVPGGSSSGSAVAVAAGMAAFSLGTDTAGSGRVPAALNGIVGLKPSLGMLSSTGLVPACRTLDTISVFAATVEDAAEATAIAQGYDIADPWSRNLPAPAPLPVAPALRIGVPLPAQRLFFGDGSAANAYARDIAALEARGATLVETDFEPFYATARLLYEGPWVAERYAATKPLIEEKPEAFHPVTLAIIEKAGNFSAVDTFEALYRLAELRRAVQPALDAVDCLAVPSIPTVYTVAEVEADPVTLNSNLGTYTNFVNLLDLAAISVPVGMRDDGLPSSLTLIARSGRDGFLAGLAATLQPGGAVTAPPETGNVGNGRIELAVVGAHMSGMILNPELTGLGANFVRTVETEAAYRLFALPGTTPAKPGLLRVANGDGRKIAAEIWSLDADGFGRFVASVPAPLSIGTLSFSDGTCAKGFLVEAEAVRGARDISDYGSWRDFVKSGA